MYQKSTLLALHELLRIRATDYYDETLYAHELYVESMDKILVNHVPKKLTDLALGHLCSKLRVPLSYLKRCSQAPHLQQSNLESHLIRYPRHKSFFVRFDADKIRAIFTDKYQVIDNLEITVDLLQCLTEDTEVEYYLTDEKFIINIPKIHRNILVPIADTEDKFTGGITIVNSEVGESRFAIYTYMYRLACTNGLIAKVPTNTISFKHLKSIKRCLGVATLVCDTLKDYTVVTKALTESAEIVINRPLETIALLANHYKLTNVEVEFIQEAYFAEPGNTLYSIINAFTRAANNVTLSTETRFKLQVLGGELAMNPPKSIIFTER